jgi:hypothetical protein
VSKPITFERDGTTRELLVRDCDRALFMTAEPEDLRAAGYVPEHELTAAEEQSSLQRDRAKKAEAERDQLGSIIGRISRAITERRGASLETSPFRSVAQESAKPWKVDPNVTREQVEEAARKVVAPDVPRTQKEPWFPGGGGPADALRDEVRGWLGAVKPSERIDALEMVFSRRGNTTVGQDRHEALVEFLDEIWTRANARDGSKP